MARPGTPARSVRVPDDLWRTFVDVAGRNGDTASAVIVRAIRAYLAARTPQ